MCPKLNEIIYNSGNYYKLQQADQAEYDFFRWFDVDSTHNIVVPGDEIPSEDIELL